MSAGIFGSLLNGLTLGASRSTLGVPWSDSGSMNPGAVTPATPVYILGHPTSLTGLIVPRACHLTDLSLQLFMGASGVVGGGASTTYTVTIYKNAISGSNKVWAAYTITNPQNSTGYNMTPKIVADGDAGMDAFNGTTDYLTMILSATNCTSISAGSFHWNLRGTLD